MATAARVPVHLAARHCRAAPCSAMWRCRQVSHDERCCGYHDRRLHQVLWNDAHKVRPALRPPSRSPRVLMCSLGGTGFGHRFGVSLVSRCRHLFTYHGNIALHIHRCGMSYSVATCGSKSHATCSADSGAAVRTIRSAVRCRHAWRCARGTPRRLTRTATSTRSSVGRCARAL